MTSSRPLDADTITRLWEQRWPGCPPIAYLLRDTYPERWVRFHSLPESKRYPDNEAEYATVLARHYTVLTELATDQTLLIITCRWTGPLELSQTAPRRVEVAADGIPWTVVPDPDPDEDAEYRSDMQLYVSQRPFQPGVLDDLLRAVADCEIANVIIGPPSLRWLYHPYDGGADVILPMQADRDDLKERHRDWLSKHPGGL